MAISRSQLVNLPGAQPLMNPLTLDDDDHDDNDNRGGLTITLI